MPRETGHSAAAGVAAAYRYPTSASPAASISSSVEATTIPCRSRMLVEAVDRVLTDDREWDAFLKGAKDGEFDLS